MWGHAQGRHPADAQPGDRLGHGDKPWSSSPGAPPILRYRAGRQRQPDPAEPRAGAADVTARVLFHVNHLWGRRPFRAHRRRPRQCAGRGGRRGDRPRRTTRSRRDGWTPASNSWNCSVIRAADPTWRPARRCGGRAGLRRPLGAAAPSSSTRPLAASACRCSSPRLSLLAAASWRRNCCTSPVQQTAGREDRRPRSATS